VDGCQDHERTIAHRMLVIARCHTAILLQPVDHTLDHVAAAVRLSIEAGGPSSCRSLGLARLLLILSLRDHMADLATTQNAANAEVAEASIAEQPRGTLADLPTGPTYADAIEQRLDLRAVMALPCGKDDRERPSLSVAAYVQLGAEAAAASSQGFIAWMKIPLFAGSFGAPAAC